HPAWQAGPAEHHAGRIRGITPARFASLLIPSSTLRAPHHRGGREQKRGRSSYRRPPLRSRNGDASINSKCDGTSVSSDAAGPEGRVDLLGCGEAEVEAVEHQRR